MRILHRLLLFILLSGGSIAHAAPIVKLSQSGICHDQSSGWFSRTSNFTAYDSMADCLKVGRAPRGYTPNSDVPSQNSGYERDKFGGWSDDDRDCLNTRHELLASLSTRTPIYSENGCRVVRGRWIDPYTNQIFLDATAMDIDHIVPLAWAWDHGADSWMADRRAAFANDMRNLFAVDAGANRSKGARGPLEWLPPDAGFHCQYMLRFERIMRIYDLHYTPRDAARFQNLKTRVCS